MKISKDEAQVIVDEICKAIKAMPAIDLNALYQDNQELDVSVVLEYIAKIIKES